MRVHKAMLVWLACGGWSAGAMAQDAPARAWGESSGRVYGSLGTQGLGAGFAKTLNPSMDWRVGVSVLHHSTTSSGQSLHADADLKLQNLGLYADYFPSASSGFRLTAGVQAGHNKVTLKGKPDSANSITVNGQVYAFTAGDSVDGQLNMGSVAPYLGIGYSQRASAQAGWSMNFDLGVRFGKADVSLTRTGFGSLSTAQQQQLDSDLQAEQARLADDLKVLKTYPVVALGLSYRW